MARRSDVRPDGRHDLRLEVQDSGIGIASEAQERLFGKFAQGDAFTTRAYGGSGPGLAISRELARLMDSDVTWWRRTTSPIVRS